MKKYRFSSILLTLSLLMGLLTLPAGAIPSEDLDLYCTNAILVDVNHKEVLYEQAAYERAYPASITKVMTALLVMEALEDGRIAEDTVVTVSENASRKTFSNESTANLKTGEEITVLDLLYCLLLPSANDAAKALAEAVSGSVEIFVENMNERAVELGCRDTNFVNPNGLHDDQHYTTAYDISLYMMAALEYDLFREIIATTDYSVPATNMSKERYFFNTNGLISNLYYLHHVYDKCIGGKTGTTDEAGRCLAAVAEDGDSCLVSVVLGSGPVYLENGDSRQGQFTESTRLLEHGFNNFHRVTITREEQPVDTVAVTLSREADQVMVKPVGSFTLTLPKSVDPDTLDTEITLFSDTVEAPVAEGQHMGTMTLSYEGEELGQLDLVAVNAVERSELLYKKMLFLNFMEAYGKLILAGVIGLLILICVLIFFLRRRRRFSRRRSSYRGSHRGNYRGTRR